MPIDIPILYTGQNAARPDWKSLGRTIRDSYRRIKEDVMAQQRYEDIKAEKRRQEFLKETDIDRLNFGNEQVQAIEAANYNSWHNTVTDIVKDREGDLSETDIMAIRTANNKYANEMMKYKVSEEKRQQDIKTASLKENIDKFDKDKLLEIVNWDYNKNGLYTGDALKEALRKTTEEEWLRKDTKDFGNADYWATYIADYVGKDLNGDPVKYKDEYNKLLWTDTGKVDNLGRKIYDLNEDEAVRIQQQRYSLPSREQDLMSMMEDFDEQVPDKDKELYIKRWSGGNADDTDPRPAIAWYTLKNADRLFAKETQEVAIKEPVTTKFYYSFGGDKTTINLEDPDTLTYGGETFDNVYQLGSKDIKMKEGFTIKDAREEVGDSLKDVGDKRYNNAVVVGVNVVNGKATDVIFSVPSDKYAKNEKGEDVYQIGSGYKAVKGTLDELVVLLNSDMETVKRLAVRSKSEGDKTIVVAPAEGNTEALKGYVINGNAITPSKKQKVESFDEATEAKIQSFMSKNKIKDKNEAIKILKENKII